MVLDVADAARREAEAVSVRREVVEALAIVAVEAAVEVDHEDSLGLEASAVAVDEEAPHVAEVEEGTRWQDAHHERRFGRGIGGARGVMAHTIIRRWMLCRKGLATASSSVRLSKRKLV